jgi:hypothetical protein
MNRRHITCGRCVGSRKRDQGGYVLIIALIFFLAGGVAAVATMSDGILRESKTVRSESLSKQGYFASESALEDAVYRIKSGRQMGSTGSLSVASSTASVTVSTAGDGSRNIVSSADTSSVFRKTSATLSGGDTIGLDYALQSGVGGIDLGSGVEINGDVYTAGSIRADSNTSISGLAVAGEVASASVDQANDSPSVPTQSIVFGNANSTQDFAQSFTVSASKSVMGVRLYIKKVGNPSNATIKITASNGSSPNFNTSLTSGTLSSSLLSTSYQWIDIPLTANPVLDSSATYWIVIDANSNASNYYEIAANSSYANGQAKVGRGNNNSWNDTSPAGLDGYFNVSIGTTGVGVSGKDQWNRLSVGSAYANQVNFVNASDIIYCQTGGNNNKACDTSRVDPIVKTVPFPQASIDLWKSEALAGGTSTSRTVGSGGATIGPRKIIGNLSVSSGGTLRVSGTLWVTGSVTIDGGATVRSDDPAQSFSIVSDGLISVSGGAHVEGSSGSYILLLSTNAGASAISLSGGANSAAVAAPYGTVNVTGGTEIKAIYADHISISGGAQVQYNTGMSSLNLSGASLSGGTLNIKSWKETE